MSQSLQNKEYRTFSKGLITDVSPLTYPENASLDEDNFEITLEGYRERRNGVDYEYVNAIESVDTNGQFDTLGISVHQWKNVNNNPELHFLAVQVGLSLVIYKANVSPATADLHFIDYVNDTATFDKIQGNELRPFQSTVINGDLILATGDYCVYRLSWDEETEAMSLERHGLLVRDVWGVDDGLDADTIMERGTSDEDELSDKFLYNLLNEGWEADVKTTYAGSTKFSPCLLQWMDKHSIWPSHEMVPSSAWASKPPSIDQDDITNNKGLQAPKGHYIIDYFWRGLSRKLVSSGEYLTTNFHALNVGWGSGNSGAIEYIFYSDDTTQQGILLAEKALLEDKIEEDKLTTYMNTYYPALNTTDLPNDEPNTDDQIENRKKGCFCLTTYAGRVFYSGFETRHSDTDIRSLNIGNTVLFSQVVDGRDKIGKCYQEGDPTSYESFDLIDSDGGLIVVAGMGTAKKMVPLGEHLIIFANNGIWSISGGSVGFSATNFSVNKISDNGCVSGQSVISSEDAIFYWSDNGIFVVGIDQQSVLPVIRSVTQRRIDTFYRDIPQLVKANVTGAYDFVNKTVRWLYSDDSSYDGVNSRYRYNRQLNYNITLDSFYPFTFQKIDGTTTPSGYLDVPVIAGIYSAPVTSVTASTETVFDGGVAVTDSSVTVTTSVTLTSETLYPIKYIVFTENSVSTFHDLRQGILSDTDYLDWYTEDSTGLDAPAYLRAGQEVLGDTQRKKQAIYLTTNFKRTETGFDELNNYAAESPSSCLVTAYWDFADHSNSGKIGTQFQAYRLSRWYIPADAADPFNYGQSVITTKNKLRGRGRALSLKFDTEAGKKCIIYGWGVLFTGNTSP